MPKSLREPKVLDSSLEEMLLIPRDLNRVTKVDTEKTKSKLNDQPTENAPEKRTADSSFSNCQTQSSADSSNSIFKLPEWIRNPVHSTSISDILNPEPDSTRTTAPLPEPKAPVSNLDKTIAYQKAERAAQSSSIDSTSLSTDQKPVQQTVTVQAKQQSPQVSNMVSRYGWIRK